LLVSQYCAGSIDLAAHTMDHATFPTPPTRARAAAPILCVRTVPQAGWGGVGRLQTLLGGARWTADDSANGLRRGLD
jgi:hypothetical protein